MRSSISLNVVSGNRRICFFAADLMRSLYVTALGPQFRHEILVRRACFVGGTDDVEDVPKILHEIVKLSQSEHQLLTILLAHLLNRSHYLVYGTRSRHENTSYSESYTIFAFFKSIFPTPISAASLMWLISFGFRPNRVAP